MEKAYETPQLVEYGSLKELVRDWGFGVNVDARKANIQGANVYEDFEQNDDEG